MSLLKAEDLLTQGDDIGAVGIYGSSGKIAPVINRVNRRE